VFDLAKEVVLVTVKERILAIRLLEKAEKQPAFSAAIGLEWSKASIAAPEQTAPSQRTHNT